VRAPRSDEHAALRGERHGESRHAGSRHAESRPAEAREARTNVASPTSAVDGDERSRLLELVRRHGFNTTSFQTLGDGFSYWWDAHDACIAYVDTGRAWVVAGAPLAPVDRLHEVVTRFTAAARIARRRVVFFASQDRLAELVDMRRVPVGLQPVWDPRDWERAARSSRSLRNQLNRAANKGVVVRRLRDEEIADEDSRIRVEVECLIRRWFAGRRMTPMRFLVRVQPFSFVEQRRSFVAERDGRIVGFASAVPVFARGGWSIDVLVRDRRAPNGTVESLIDAAMRQSAREGSEWMTLGLAPLAGPVPGWMRRVGTMGRALYDFQGVGAFKAKLSPTRWEPVYLMHSADTSTFVAVCDALRAFAGGGLTVFGLRTFLRGRPFALWMLAAALVPWTILLASPVAARWFPSDAIRFAWIGLDALLIAALFALASRFRAMLGVATAIAVTADAILSGVQAVSWNAPRVSSAIEAAFVGVACLAPALAAFVLWNRRAHETDACRCGTSTWAHAESAHAE